MAKDVMEDAREIHAQIVAARLVDELCTDPEVWATHGMPPEEKLDILQKRIAAALVAFRS